MALFKMVLKPCKNVIIGINSTPNMNEQSLEPDMHETFKCKSKPYCEKIGKAIVEAPIFENYWKRTLKLDQTPHT